MKSFNLSEQYKIIILLLLIYIYIIYKYSNTYVVLKAALTPLFCFLINVLLVSRMSWLKMNHLVHHKLFIIIIIIDNNNTIKIWLIDRWIDG